MSLDNQVFRWRHDKPASDLRIQYDFRHKLRTAVRNHGRDKTFDHVDTIGPPESWQPKTSEDILDRVNTILVSGRLSTGITPSSSLLSLVEDPETISVRHSWYEDDGVTITTLDKAATIASFSRYSINTGWKAPAGGNITATYLPMWASILEGLRICFRVTDDVNPNRHIITRVRPDLKLSTTPPIPDADHFIVVALTGWQIQDLAFTDTFFMCDRTTALALAEGIQEFVEYNKGALAPSNLKFTPEQHFTALVHELGVPIYLYPGAIHIQRRKTLIQVTPRISSSLAQFEPSRVNRYLSIHGGLSFRRSRRNVASVLALCVRNTRTDSDYSSNNRPKLWRVVSGRQGFPELEAFPWASLPGQTYVMSHAVLRVIYHKPFGSLVLMLKKIVNRIILKRDKILSAINIKVRD